MTSDACSLVTVIDDDQPKSQNSSSESDWVVVSHIQESESSRNRRPVGKVGGHSYFKCSKLIEVRF